MLTQHMTSTRMASSTAADETPLPTHSHVCTFQRHTHIHTCTPTHTHTHQNEVLTGLDSTGGVKYFLLNRPRALNALNLNMAKIITKEMRVGGHMHT